MARICSGLALVAAAALLMATQAQALDTCPAGCSTCGDLCICNDTPTYNGKALAPWSSAVEGKATIYNMSPTGTATSEQGCCRSGAPAGEVQLHCSLVLDTRNRSEGPCLPRAPAAHPRTPTPRSFHPCPAVSKALVDVIDPFAPGKGVVWTENTSGCNGAVLQPVSGGCSAALGAHHRAARDCCVGQCGALPAPAPPAAGQSALPAATPPI